MTDRSREGDAEKPKESIGEIVRTVVYALLIALVFRTLVFQPFWIPSGSMKSTLLIGDYLFISKYAYGYSKFSLPFGKMIPDSLFPGRILGGEPDRGDVIVFRLPSDNETDYIKRLIGLPGDRIQVKEGLLYINDEPVEVSADGEFVEPRVRGASQACKASVSTADLCVKESFIETLPNGRKHIILDADENRSGSDNTKVFIVPDGHYFFMGDNRDNSRDSRFYPNGVGFVPAQNLLGRAELIFLSSDGSFWQFWNWRGDRFFKWIE